MASLTKRGLLLILITVSYLVVHSAQSLGETDSIAMRSHSHARSLLTTTTFEEIVYATYENGSLSSGIAGLTGTKANATDAAYIADFGRNSNKSICYKTLLNDTDYYSSGTCRSESDTLYINDTLYVSGMEFIYRFSLLLKDWQDWDDGAIPIDIIWQFKHTDGAPDAMMGIKRNSLVLRYGEGSDQSNIVSDVRDYDNKWIDIETHIKWEDTDTGFIRIRAQTPDDANLTEVFYLNNTKTFTDNGSGDFGYLKWGLYRPDSTLDNNYDERIACHDNVQIIKVTSPADYPSVAPTLTPTFIPTFLPTDHPSDPTFKPTQVPTTDPIPFALTTQEWLTEEPTVEPSAFEFATSEPSGGTVSTRSAGETTTTLELPTADPTTEIISTELSESEEMTTMEANIIVTDIYTTTNRIENESGCIGMIPIMGLMGTSVLLIIL